MKLHGQSFGCGLAVGALLTFGACVVVAGLLWFPLRLAQSPTAPAPTPTSAADCPAVGDEAVTRLLQPIRQKHGLPALAGAIVTSDGLSTLGAVGVRKRGTDIGVTLDDQWHLGSDTKAMTATLAARLVERQQLRWDSTLAEIFPELAAGFHAEMKGVTLAQLLSHRAGLPANLSLSRFRGDDAPAERLRAVRETLAQAPKSKPGTRYEYSNLGYIIASAALEKITGKSCEAALREEIFTPLQMTNTGFGGTGTAGEIDQPWPHGSTGKPMSANGPAMDNPPVMGPAGRVHCSMQDWAKFIQDQLRGARGGAALLPAGSYRALRTPPFGGDYALGWSVLERPWGGGTVLHHAGDNTMNHANVWIAPQRDFAILVCVNQGGDTAAQAADEAVGALIQLHEQMAAAGSAGKPGDEPVKR